MPRYFGKRTQADGPSSFVRVEESIQVDIQSTTHTDDEKEKVVSNKPCVTKPVNADYIDCNRSSLVRSTI